MESKSKIEILPRAEGHLDTLREEEGERAYSDALDDILNLEDDPIPRDAVKLRRSTDRYRIYTNRSRYRIIYRVTSRKVIVERVLPRPIAYRGLEKWGRDRTNPEE